MPYPARHSPPRYRDGLILQLLNPKGIVATLPVATLQFPAAGIQGPGLVVWSMGLAPTGRRRPWKLHVDR